MSGRTGPSKMPRRGDHSQDQDGPSQRPVSMQKYLPTIKFRTKAEDIFIPAVSAQTDPNDLSPRTTDSGAVNLFSNAGSPVTKASLGGPVSMGPSGGTMMVDVTASSSGPPLPDTLKTLDRHLPQEMRRAREKVKNEAMVNLKQTLSMHNAMMANRDEDDYTLSSEDPHHDASGASVKLFGKPHVKPKGHLWGSSHQALDFNRPLSSQLSMEEKERVIEVTGSLDDMQIKQEAELDALADRLMRAKASADPAMMGSGEMFFDDNSAGFPSAPQSPGYPERGLGEDEDGLDEMSQSSMDLIEQYREGAMHKPALAKDLSTSEDAVKPRTPGEIQFGNVVTSAMHDAGIAAHGTDTDTFTDASGTAASPSMSIVSGVDRLSPPVSPHQMSRKGRGAVVVPEHMQMMVPKVELTSKARATLQNLGKFVAGHMNRKVMVAWTTIEQRFQKSSHRKIEHVRDANGLTHPVKYSALYLSALTGTLCSPQVRCSYKDLYGLFSGFGMTEAEIFKSRRLAALRIVLGPTNGKGLKQEEELISELGELMAEEEPMVTEEQLLNAVFPADLKERKRMFDSLEAEKTAFVKKMMAEKEKKEQLKQAAEMRRVKMISDFERSREDIQFPKGLVQFHRLQTLRDLGIYCERAYEDHNAAADVQVNPENIALIGLEAFPECVKKGVREEEERMRAKQRMFTEAMKRGKKGTATPERSPSPLSTSTSPGEGDAKKAEVLKKLKQDELASKEMATKVKNGRIGYSGEFRVSIQRTKADNLSLVNLIREVVKYGKGLNGMAYRDVIELIQAYSTTRLQAIFRGFKRRWRYAIARNKWRAIFGEVKMRHFGAWSVFIRHVYDTRDYCWRKLVAWRVYSRNAKRRREHFRINFWPFYVWHRWASASRTAKEKARFLADRVVPTVRSLRVFRAWKGVYMSEKALRDTADGLVDKMLRMHGNVSLAWWRRWTRRRTKMRTRWYKYGIVTYKHKIFMRKVTPFLIWKMVWFYRKTLHNRIINLSPLYRQNFVKAVPEESLNGEPETLPVVRMPTNGEKKAQFREAYEHKLEEESVASSKSGASGKKGKKSKKQKKKEEAAAAAAAADSGPSKLLRPFLFHASERHKGNDIDSDGEEEEFVPQVMQEVYRDHIPELVAPTEVEFLGEADDFIFEKVFVLARKYAVVDNWNLVEWSLRYHKLIHRALRNIRIHARVKKHARQSQYNHSRNVKRRCFMAFLAWMLRDPAAIDVASQSSAEIVYAEAKAHRMDKMMKWRDVAIEIKQKLDRDEEDPLDADRELTEHDKRQRRARRLEKEAKLKADIEAGIEPFKPPNFLEWDREDRETEFNRAEQMLEISKKVRAEAFDLSAKADVVSSKFNADEKQLSVTVQEVFSLEDKESSRALDNEFEYVDKFKIHAAGNMLEVLWKVYKEVQQYLLREERKKYFRILRMPMLERRALIMCNRKKMVNWIRICRRLGSLYELAPIYNRRRTAWCFFNRWLKLVEKESLDTSPGLQVYLRRKLEIYPSFHEHLKAHGFVKTVYPNNKRLYAVCSELIAVFKRWTMMVSEDQVLRVMESKAHRAYEIKLTRRVFESIRTMMTPEETFQFRSETKPYVLRRMECDLDQISKRFISRRKRNLLICIRKYNRKFTFIQMKAAKAAPSFRKFLLEYQTIVTRRMTREQRIMIDAFEGRGTCDYGDVVAPESRDDPCMPGLMRRLDGAQFRDPHPFNEREHNHLEPPLPGGFRLAKIRINYQDFNGNVEASVTGWQVVWAADGLPDIEGPKRGKWKGAAMSVQELVIPKHDFVMGIEYLYEGTAILGVRIKMFFAGFSRWLGGRPTMSSLSVMLDVEKAPVFAFERDYKSAGRDETENPAMPRAFVIGFTGFEHDRKVSGMGLVVRKIRDQHVFSYTWVKDAINKQSAGGAGPVTEFNVRGVGGEDGDSQATIGVQTLPAIVDPNMATFQRGEPSVSESLTADHSFPQIVDSQPGKDAAPGETADDMSSIGQGSLANAPEAAAGAAGEGTGGTQGGKGGDAGSVGDETVMDPTAVMELLSSEEQFFDVLRMRTMETHTARGRAEGFARRLWQSKALRSDPQLSKLTGINIIAPLTRWLFQAICKRLVRSTPTELQGEELLDESREKKAQEERLNRQALAAALKMNEFKAKPQAWQQLKILGPKDRAAKKLFNEEVRLMALNVNNLREKALDLRELSAQLLKEGKDLLPRMQLSEYTCENIRLKIAAARHKETLLERMDMNAIKKALSGGDAKNSELSEVSMEMIRSSLAEERPKTSGVITLEDVIESEMARNDKPPTRTSASITLPSTPASVLDREGSPLYSKRSGSPGRASTGMSNSASAGGLGIKPSYMNTHAEQRVALGASFRKISGINPPNHLSTRTAKRDLHERDTVGETRWVRKKSRGQLKLVRDKLLSTSLSSLELERHLQPGNSGVGRYEEWD